MRIIMTAKPARTEGPGNKKLISYVAEKFIVGWFVEYIPNNSHKKYKARAICKGADQIILR